VDVIINETLGIANVIPNSTASHVEDDLVLLPPPVVSEAPTPTETSLHLLTDQVLTCQS
jgi:hypothetical protein